ncbi:M15 family metallopeptidase [Salinicoccus sp. ID82-1]|uniref:M15 family metallopeptidase n=1 Tax=Salinicoccus sp. ID82-1 TaxID=2820269 RepID=UPI001F1FBEEE|nr:M15 family metallopeptidase [Salinicoccus sp. ID82-1]
MINRLKSLPMMLFSFISLSGLLFADLDDITIDDKNDDVVIDDKNKDEEKIELDFEEMPDALHPEVEKKAEALEEKAEEKNINITITSGFRSFETQDALYSKGRSLPGQVVTNARGGESYHNYGLAIDYAVEADGKVIWNTDYDSNDNGKSDWFEVADIAKELGFEWGGDWESFKDYPHLEMTFDYSIRELQEEYEDQL